MRYENFYSESILEENELMFQFFSSLLIAACEKKAIVLFDPITNRQTKAVKNAHLDSVNCVK